MNNLFYSSEMTRQYNYYSVGAAGLYLSYSDIVHKEAFLYKDARGVWIESPNSVSAQQPVLTGDTIYLAMEIGAANWLEYEDGEFDNGQVGWGKLGSDSKYEWQLFTAPNGPTGQLIDVGTPLVIASVATPGSFVSVIDGVYFGLFAPNVQAPAQFTFNSYS